MHKGRNDGPGDRFSFYDCFGGIHSGHSLQYELLGLQTLMALKQNERPFPLKETARRIWFFDTVGNSGVSVYIVCQTNEARKFKDSDLGILPDTDMGKLYEQMLELMT